MFELSEGTLQIRDLARDFARAEVMPGAAERDRTHEFPRALVNKLGELGFLGMFVPEQYEGSGLSLSLIHISEPTRPY